MALLGERIPARRALEWGLVTRVTADDAFEAEVDALAERLADRPHAGLRGHQAAAQRRAVRPDSASSSRSRPSAPAGAGRIGRLRGGRARLHREARRQVRRGVSDPARPMNTLRSPMGPSRPLSVLRRALPAAILILLVTAATASAGILAPESGAGSRNADDTRTLYWLIFGLGMVVFLGVEGILLLVPGQVPRQEGPRRRADPRQHAPGDRLDGGRRPPARLPHRRDLRDAAGHQEPGALRRSTPRATRSTPRPRPSPRRTSRRRRTAAR